MDSKGFEYEVKTRIRLNQDEISLLWYCSRKHYDGKCQSASDIKAMRDIKNNRFSPLFFLAEQVNHYFFGLKPKPKYQWKESDIKKIKEIEVRLNCDEMDTCCKILEQSRFLGDKEGAVGMMLSKHLRDAMQELSRETCLRNPHLYAVPNLQGLDLAFYEENNRLFKSVTGADLPEYAKQISDDVLSTFCRYLAHGDHPGDFMVAFLTCDMKKMMNHADDATIAGLRPLYHLVYNRVPGSYWGSVQAVEQHMATQREKSHA